MIYIVVAINFIWQSICFQQFRNNLFLLYVLIVLTQNVLKQGECKFWECIFLFNPFLELRRKTNKTYKRNLLQDYSN